MQHVRGVWHERLVRRSAAVKLPRLQRTAADRLVFGVCAGIARRVGAHVLLVRLVCAALLVITGGVGLIVYGALVLLMPAEPAPIVPWSERSPVTPVLLLVFGTVLYALGLHVVTPPLRCESLSPRRSRTADRRR
jgi:phage shock protein PspC (stress-responsive transcriptional regulator)